MINFNPSILEKYFHEWVREKCMGCKRYGESCSCPPFVPNIGYYKDRLPKFKNGILVCYKYRSDFVNWEKQGRQSSLDIANCLDRYRLQYSKPYTDFLVFGAGSCKRCYKCGNTCYFPEEKLIPMEATGLDVVSLFYDLTKVKLVFPIKEYFYRVGMVLYD